MTNIINKTSEEFLYTYLNANAPTGYEWEGQKLWLKYLEPYIDKWELDNYGTAYGIINPDKPYKVVIEGHADEISWYVNHISDKGYISVIRNGGSDHLIAPSMRVILHGTKGKVKGVFGWPAIHTRTGKEAELSPSMDNIFIDIGADTKDEVLGLGIHPGTVITFDAELTEVNGKYYAGRALDNRIGGFCIAEVARLLKENNVELPFSLYIVNAVQEEIGLRGAEMIAHNIKPDVAIITDVCHDTNTPLVNTKKEGDLACGKGPVLTHAPAVHNKLLQKVKDAANAKEIPIQLTASSRSTGTDTDAFAYSGTGVPSVLISLPLRYMHTTVEMAHKNDVENVIKLMYETLLTIEANESFKYFDKL
jgi:putative aminopeptidase FrvX